MMTRVLGRPRQEPPPEAALAVRPIRRVDAPLQPAADGATWRLTVPVRPPRWAARFLRMSSHSTKTFEFDAIGARVWDRCDGRTAVSAIVADVANEYGLSPREAEVATRAFLRTLALKGLVGVATDGPGEEENATP